MSPSGLVSQWSSTSFQRIVRPPASRVGASGAQRFRLTGRAFRPAPSPWGSKACAPTRYAPSTTPPPLALHPVPVPVAAPMVQGKVQVLALAPLAAAPWSVPFRYHSAPAAAWSVDAVKVTDDTDVLVIGREVPDVMPVTSGPSLRLFSTALSLTCRAAPFSVYVTVALSCA